MFGRVLTTPLLKEYFEKIHIVMYVLHFLTVTSCLGGKNVVKVVLINVLVKKYKHTVLNSVPKQYFCLKNKF